MLTAFCKGFADRLPKTWKVVVGSDIQEMSALVSVNVGLNAYATLSQKNWQGFGGRWGFRFQKEQTIRLTQMDYGKIQKLKMSLLRHKKQLEVFRSVAENVYARSLQYQSKLVANVMKEFYDEFNGLIVVRVNSRLDLDRHVTIADFTRKNLNNDTAFARVVITEDVLQSDTQNMRNELGGRGIQYDEEERRGGGLQDRYKVPLSLRERERKENPRRRRIEEELKR